MNIAFKNAQVLERELDWLSEVIDTRLKLYFANEANYPSVEQVPAPVLDDESMYSGMVGHYQMDMAERIVLLLALAPYLRPQLLDVFFVQNSTYDRGFSEFGGVKGVQYSGFLPTGETVMFILAGNDLAKRFLLQSMFEREHYFFRHNIIRLAPGHGDEPPLSRQLTISNEFLGYFTTGATNKPNFSAEFPAKLLSTKLDWDDLVLPEITLEQVLELNAWIEHGDTLLNDMGLGKKIKPGYRALFYGPPGTGKTLTASLLGKSNELDVYRIDLSMVVSKYIGETEKNLAGVFDMAENKNWILFFDEADALFGKRTATKDSNDRHANQEVSYLLQRIEDFPGLVILATNLKANVDEAFARRFQSMVNFPMPDAPERLLLWRHAFEGCKLEDSLDFEDIAEKYVIAGGGIINVLRYANLQMLSRKKTAITKQMILGGIKKEFSKEGKTI